MASKLTKPVRRMVSTRRSGELVITLASEGLYLREKGRRTQYGPLDYGKLLIRGAAEYVAQQKREKADARKQHRLLRTIEVP